jgi:hypothetical protein
VAVAKQTDSEDQQPGIIRCKSLNGTLIFDGTWVTIDRSKGIVARGVGASEKRIALTQITSVRWQEPSHLFRGYIAFTLAGGIETQSRFGGRGRRSWDVMKDDNAIVVTYGQRDEFLALKAKIEEALAQHHAPSPPSAVAAIDDPAEQLKKLADLHQRELLVDLFDECLVRGGIKVLERRMPLCVSGLDASDELPDLV